MIDPDPSRLTLFHTLNHCLAGACLAIAGWSVFAQTPASPTPPQSSALTENLAAETPPHTPPASLAEGQSITETNSIHPSAKSPEESRTWLALSKRQRQALAPLSDKWHELTPQQKQKWLTLARSFYQLSDPEQMTLHGRMREWASLSPPQRALARFNFNSAMSMTIEDKRAQWLAYQQLSDEERNKLTSGLKAPLKSAARSTSPPNKRLVTPPPLPSDNSKIFPRVAPSQPIHPKTLLPLPAR